MWMDIKMEARLIGRLFILLGMFLVPVASQTNDCQDLDTTACVLLQRQKPDLCSEPTFSGVACKRFCGLCRLLVERKVELEANLDESLWIQIRHKALMCYDCPTPVKDLNNCNATKACAANETCMLKHLRAVDGHHEYIMTCEPKNVCEGFGFGFAFGKRAAEPHVLESRDVSLECCDTDFCNYPTSTTMSTTPTTPVTTVRPIHGCSKDVIFLLDDSGSIGPSNFGHAKDFVKSIVTSLDIGPHNSQIGMVTFASHPQSVWHLNASTNKADLLLATDRLKFYGGTTRTHEALDFVREKMLTFSNGDRVNVENVLVVITDGRSMNKNATITAAQLIHQVADDVIAIEIGNTDETEVLIIATDKQHVFDLQSYSSILTIIPKVISLICPNP